MLAVRNRVDLRQKESYMDKRTFRVKAVWDNEAGVYVSESDIIGLHIEAVTVEEFEEVMMDLAPELIVANHISPSEFAEKPYKDLVPAILWQRPEKAAA
jgi:hypothetical protein